MMITTFIFIIGSILGSFLNVCISRLPQNKSIIFPGSTCPACGVAIKWYHNIPLLSYIILKGRCRYCNRPIAIRYPLVELFTGIGLAVLYSMFSLTTVFFLYAVLFFILIVITFIDIEHQLIPNKINAFGLMLGLITVLVTDFSLKDALAGIFTGGGTLFVVALIGDIIFRKESMGGGDIKMAAMVGCFIGCYGIVVSLFYAFIAGGVIGIFAKIYHREYLPFAPFITLGTIVFLFAGDFFVTLFIR